VSSDIGEHYRSLRDKRGWSRREVSDRTGLTQGKIGRIEGTGTFKAGEQAVLDTLYESDAPEGNGAQKPPEVLGEDVAQTREIYLRLYVLVPEPERLNAHAEAMGDFPKQATFDESWSAATPPQRLEACRKLEKIVSKFVQDTGEARLEPTAAKKVEPKQQTIDGKTEVTPPKSHPDPTEDGFVIQGDGRAWRHNGEKWEREPTSDAALLEERVEAAGDRVAFGRWGKLRPKARVKLEGDSGAFTFESYVIPGNGGSAYVTLIGAGKSRTVAPERVLDGDGAPIIEARYATAVTDDGRIHAAPYSHHGLDLGDKIKLRCGEWGWATWAHPYSSRQLEPALCARCVEQTGGQ